MIILGIDPGTVRVGYGVIQKGGDLSMLACGLIGDVDRSSADRLSYIGNEIKNLIKKYKPDAVGVEKIYFSKNKKTALAVAEARGVIVSTVNNLGVPVLEFSPTDIKSVVAGDGRCDKKTLEKIVCITLREKSIGGPDDISDALAVAIRASFELTN